MDDDHLSEKTGIHQLGNLAWMGHDPSQFPSGRARGWVSLRQQTRNGQARLIDGQDLLRHPYRPNNEVEEIPSQTRSEQLGNHGLVVELRAVDGESGFHMTEGIRLGIGNHSVYK